MTVILRTALASDRDAIIDLILVLNLHEAGLTQDRRRDRAGAAGYYDELEQRLARRNGRIVLAEEEGQIIAVMGFCIDEDAAYVVDELRRHGTVTDLVVHEACRGRGVGSLLLGEAERLAREAGCRRLTIGALSANEGAQRLYSAVGFTPYISILVKAI